MSLASEWATRKPEPLSFVSVGGEEYQAEVDEEGCLTLEDLGPIAPEEAVKLGRWLIEVFGAGWPVASSDPVDDSRRPSPSPGSPEGGG